MIRLKFELELGFEFESSDCESSGDDEAELSIKILFWSSSNRLSIELSALLTTKKLELYVSKLLLLSNLLKSNRFETESNWSILENM